VDEETMPSHWSVLRVLFRLQCFTLMAGSHKGHPVRNMRSKKIPLVFVGIPNFRKRRSRKTEGETGTKFNWNYGR